MGDTEPREADTAPDTRRTHLKIELSTPTVNCLGKNHRCVAASFSSGITVFPEKHAGRGPNQSLTLGTQYQVSFFREALWLYTVLFTSTLNKTKMRRNVFQGFKSLNCRG